MRHAVIMAGGVGTRLWPISRKSVPKQFQKLIGDKTLFQSTVDRLKKSFPLDNIWVVTSSQYVGIVTEQVPSIRENNIISEPTGRNTAAATLLAAKKIVERDPDAVLFGLVPADHYIGKKRVFSKVTESAMRFLESQPKYIVTIGTYPTQANTGLGYIKIGKKLTTKIKHPFFSVASFHEKPNTKTAEEFVSSGEYLWNTGYYLFNGQQIIKYFEKLAPKILKTVDDYIANPSLKKYSKIPSEAIDKAISEKLKNMVVIPTRMEWSDIGNWAALHRVLESRGRKARVARGDYISKETQNTLVMGGNKLIATIGLKDTVVIDTDDVILVCDKGSVQDVKKVVEQLEKQGKEHLL